MSTSTLELSQQETKLINETVFEKLSSRDPVMVKEAIDAVNDFTRTKMREDGFLRRIMPPIPISNDWIARSTPTSRSRSWTRNRIRPQRSPFRSRRSR